MALLEDTSQAIDYQLVSKVTYFLAPLHKNTKRLEAEYRADMHKKRQRRASPFSVFHRPIVAADGLFAVVLVRNSQLLASLCAA